MFFFQNYLENETFEKKNIAKSLPVGLERALSSAVNAAPAPGWSIGGCRSKGDGLC